MPGEGSVYYNFDRDEHFMVVRLTRPEHTFSRKEGVIVVYETGYVDQYTLEELENKFVIADKKRWKPSEKAKTQVERIGNS